MSRNRNGEFSRRAALALVDSGGLVGIVDRETVKRNSRDPVVEIQASTTGTVSDDTAENTGVSLIRTGSVTAEGAVYLVVAGHPERIAVLKPGCRWYVPVG